MTEKEKEIRDVLVGAAMFAFVVAMFLTLIGTFVWSSWHIYHEWPEWKRQNDICQRACEARSPCGPSPDLGCDLTTTSMVIKDRCECTYTGSIQTQDAGLTRVGDQE